MPQLHAYLSFDGNCAQAVKTYARILGAKLEKLITFADMPMGQPVAPEHANRVMHAYLVHKDFAFMAGDIPPNMPYEGIKGVSMTLNYDSADAAKPIFAALADGGTVTMPPGETPWADYFGMVTDKFGVPWIVNGGMREI